MRGIWRPNITATYIDTHSFGHRRCIFLVLLMLNRRPGGAALGWVLACSTTSCLYLVWTPTVWLPVLTELYNSSTSTQSPTQSLECHVWSSSCGNNCHAVQRSHTSGASVYECIIGFYLVPFRQSNPPTRFLSITGQWNVSLPSGASLWNGMFARTEGQYITHWRTLYPLDLV